MKPLIIVESGTKIKTISKLLNYEYNVTCSYGHFNNLPSKHLGINTDSWKGEYIITNKKAIDNIRKLVKLSDVIYIAADPDIEGEAIAHHIFCHIYDLLKHKQCHRIVFNEITKNALQNALENPRKINDHIVEAQETRRFVDRIVGYKLSPILWNVFNDKTLSVGRVQSIALLLCCNHYNQLINYRIKHYWTGKGTFSNKESSFEFILYNNNEVVKENWESINNIINLFDFTTNFESKFSQNIVLQHPPAPFTTTSLQNDAYQKFHFTSKKTMIIAQQLYENGYITYMRTDSIHISNSFKNIIIKYINTNYKGLSQFRSHKNRIVNAQEAHEAIRVTDIEKKTCDIDSNCKKLYELIWKRTIASQMIDAEFTEIKTILKYNNHDYTFINTKSFLSKQGFLIIYDKNTDDHKKYIKNISKIVPVKYECLGTIGSLPSLLNEVSLIKELEKNGIGRPSTYASIVEKILDKKYVQKSSYVGKEIKLKNRIVTLNGTKDKEIVHSTSSSQKDLLIPTEIGINIIEYLNKNIQFLLNIKFTSNMEITLDKITNGEFTKHGILNEFYNNHILPLCVGSNNKNNSQDRKTGIVKTKYGYCYYHSDTDKYTNIESFLKWKKKSVESLSKCELRFLQSIPKLLDDGSYLCIGPYGLYRKVDGKNIKIDKNTWDDFIV